MKEDLTADSEEKMEKPADFNRISDIIAGAEPKAIIEALLFISEKPLMIEQIKGVLEDLETTQIRQIVLELKSEYENTKGGLRIEEIAGGFQVATSRDVAPALKKFYKQRDAQRLSGPALETLAIIAYKQPVTRLDIESLRGVNVDGVIKSLLEKGLIRIGGRKDIIGRPFVYATTRQFLEYFGLRSLEDLPRMEEFANLPQAVNMPLILSNKQDEAAAAPDSASNTAEDTKLEQTGGKTNEIPTAETS